jgi:hypothetical protein
MASTGKFCPFCRSRDIHRIRRRFWMRLIPFSRFYECYGCLRTYMVMFSLGDNKTARTLAKGSEKLFGLKPWSSLWAGVSITTKARSR